MARCRTGIAGLVLAATCFGRALATAYHIYSMQEFETCISTIFADNTRAARISASPTTFTPTDFCQVILHTATPAQCAGTPTKTSW